MLQAPHIWEVHSCKRWLFRLGVRLFQRISLFLRRFPLQVQADPLLFEPKPKKLQLLPRACGQCQRGLALVLCFFLFCEKTYPVELIFFHSSHTFHYVLTCTILLKFFNFNTCNQIVTLLFTASFFNDKIYVYFSERQSYDKHDTLLYRKGWSLPYAPPSKEKERC